MQHFIILCCPSSIGSLDSYFVINAPNFAFSLFALCRVNDTANLYVVYHLHSRIFSCILENEHDAFDIHLFLISVFDHKFRWTMT